MESSESLAAESEGGNDCPLDFNGVFLDTPPIQYASSGMVVPPHIRKRARQLILALSTETLDPRRSLCQALEDVTQGSRSVDCERGLQHFVDSISMLRNECG